METDGNNKSLPDTPPAPVEAKAPASTNSAPNGLDAGRAFVQDIVSSPPQPIPGLIEKLQGGTAGEPAAETVKGKTATEQGNAAREAIRVNPVDWKHLKDWRKRPFDPNIHKVNLDGSPVIGEKNRIQCLKKGDKNPVDVILSALSNDFEEVEIEGQDEAHAQAKAVMDQGRIQRKAKRLVSMWFMGGTAAWGLRFRKGIDKRRAPLEEELVDYMVETGKEVDVPPILAATSAFVCDFEEMIYLNFGENPEQGVIKRFLLRRLPFIRWAFRGGKRKKQAETANIEEAE